MRRILVPLDGSPLAETILPDARRLAGAGGTLVLIQDIPGSPLGPGAGVVAPRPVAEVDAYLEQVAEKLRADGAALETHTMAMASVPLAIDQAASLFQADMIACATHGDGPLGRIMHGRTAWRALAHSPVPVLLHGPKGTELAPSEHRKIMVPLDGSSFGEAALPLADALAKEWQAAIWLVMAIETRPQFHRAVSISVAEILTQELAYAREYLGDRAAEMTAETHIQALIATGQIAPALVDAAKTIGITDVVLASHGKTGLARMIMGSVADGLIQRLHCPIIIIPASALANGWSSISKRIEGEPVAAGAH
jgi:nucleotide-binding universal stress UspA family protein